MKYRHYEALMFNLRTLDVVEGMLCPSAAVSLVCYGQAQRKRCAVIMSHVELNLLNIERS